MKHRTISRRIGITGSTLSGKTVFLMSLITCLQANKLEMTIKHTKVKISKYKRLPAKGGKEFEYDKLHSHLAQQKKWPEKTTDCFSYRCRFDRSDCCHSATEIEFFDFPGERVADFTMVGNDFKQWSERMLEIIRNDLNKAGLCSRFLAALESTAPTDAELIASYKEGLAQMILSCHPLISPSAFLIDAGGTVAKGGTPEEVVKGRCSGLENAEFSPLPTDYQLKHPDLYTAHAANYARYQRELVKPFTRNLLSCHKLVFLIDIADVLGSGHHKYNDTRLLISELLNYLDQGMHLLPKLSRTVKNLLVMPFGAKSRWVGSIIFVASKMDKIHESDRDKLLPLLEDLADPIVNNSQYSGLAKFKTCMSVESTESLHADSPMLKGRPLWIANEDGVRKLLPTDPDQQVSVPRVPDQWPDAWKGTEYPFVDFHPIVPAAHGNPPKQKGLGEIMTSILAD